MKKYGIFLAYSPVANLNHHGLGRYLTEFMKASKNSSNVKFVIACPSWTRDSLNELFKHSIISLTDYEVISPTKKPLILKVYEKIYFLKNRKKKNYLTHFKDYVYHYGSIAIKIILSKILNSRNLLNPFVLLALILSPFILLYAIVIFIKPFILIIIKITDETFARIKQTRIFKKFNKKRRSIIKGLKKNSHAEKFFRILFENETAILLSKINKRKDIDAWYCPTAFWPQFNKITAPKLLCIPDIVIRDFPIGFAIDDNDRLIYSFKELESTIKNGSNFVTYSHYIKQHNLINQYNIHPKQIFVIPHGANKLDNYLPSASYLENTMTNIVSKVFFRNALKKSMLNLEITQYYSDSIQFIFYASQFRPSKNILTLLKAYDYLLKKRYIGYKLILTGNPKDNPSIIDFVINNNLESDVLFLKCLNDYELAACYQLATLAVNPSLSEGGFPFTFTEALSVGTPVVMSRIPVSEEIVTDPALQELMFFDPYDWEDMANKIEWALSHLDILHTSQQPLYDKLVQRTWEHVVQEHIDILDRISSPIPSIVHAEATA